ncbi:MAG: hypothetical protein K0S00_1945 [Xanthobacteraceae bacterium]|jgi:hypothetical protein|nr:hypothetical protein [Xanthobacteraceae bacterium]
MSRESIAADLRQAELQVKQGERRIARQRNVISKLEADGHPTTDARELLRTFEAMHRLHVKDRDALLRELRAAE